MAQPDTRLISFTYAPVPFIYVVTLHSLFLYSVPPLPLTSLPIGSGYFSAKPFFRINTPTFSNPLLGTAASPKRLIKVEYLQFANKPVWAQNPDN